ncbi:MAG TPA: CmcJ/NvfI family oxidoreductase, partial [Candidatus Binataceae bacterium]|nr:CmcJ/NvfI family oxidoreductase [Candidatus Binataceae bacterium]
MEHNISASSDHIDGLINYLENNGERQVTYLYDPPEGVPARSGRNIKHTLPVYNGRAVADRLTLDGQGFAFVRHETKVVNFYDPDEVRRVYYPEVAQLVKDVTGAIRVEVFDHNVRCRPMAKAGL